MSAIYSGARAGFLVGDIVHDLRKPNKQPDKLLRLVGFFASQLRGLRIHSE
jgi:hypothetical protein